MTGAELDALVAELQCSTPLSRVKPDAARMVFLTLLSKGYDIVPPGSKGKFLEADIEKHEVLRWLQENSPLGALSYPEAHSVFNALNGMNLRIREPDRHPSGLRTTEKPFVDVKPLGGGVRRREINKAGMAGPASVFNGGESE